LLEARSWASTVLAPSSGRDSGQADVVAAAPIPRDLAEGREPRLTPVGRNTEAVDPGPADDRHSPTTLGPGAQDGIRVVADRNPFRQPTVGHGSLNFFFRSRDVDSGEEKLSHVVLRPTPIRPICDPLRGSL